MVETKNRTVITAGGKVYCQKGKDGHAIEDFKKAIELSPKYALGYDNLGAVYINRGKNGDFELAKENFEIAHSLNPDEETRKLLEGNKAKLKAKMQEQKTE